MYTKSNYIMVGTNMIVETRAIKEALVYATSHGFHYIVLKTNSLSLRNILVKNWKILWEIIELVEHIFTMIETCSVQIMHTFRKANQLANFFYSRHNSSVRVKADLYKFLSVSKHGKENIKYKQVHVSFYTNQSRSNNKNKIFQV